jgi:hypothetical protein
VFFLFNFNRDVGYDHDYDLDYDLDRDYDRDYDLDRDAGCDYDEEVVSIRLKMWQRKMSRRSRRGHRRDFHFLFLVPPVLVFAVSSFVDFRLMA